MKKSLIERRTLLLILLHHRRRNERERIVGPPLLVPFQDGTIAGTDVPMENLAEDFMQVEDLGKLVAWPGTEEQSARADDFGMVPRVARVEAGVERERVVPYSITRSSQPETLICVQQSPVGARLAAPFQTWIHGCPFLRDSANGEELFEQGE